MFPEKQKTAIKIVAIILILKILREKNNRRRPDTDSILSGDGYLKEILDGNEKHCQEMLRMKKAASFKFVWSLSK